MQRTFRFVLLACILLAFPLRASAEVIYVDDSVLYSGDGTSWATAKKTIGEALAVAPPGSEIWVAQGTYMEAIALKSGVALYGGFDGTERRLTERDIVAHATAIDGSEVRQTYDGIKPAYHVVVMDGTTDARVDGFTITGGAGDEGAEKRYGGGLYCKDLDASNAIASCTISGNSAEHGGGVYCTRASPLIARCTITSNTVRRHGGGEGAGIYCRHGSAPEIASCTIVRNAALGAGGGIYLSESLAKIVNCTIGRNSAGNFAGGILSYGSSAEIANCLIFGNSFAGVYCSGALSPTITNCTISRNDRYGLAWSAGCPVLRNTILSDNLSYGLIERDPACRLILTRCLFFGNSLGDFRHANGRVHTSANAVNMYVAGASNNVAGDPQFVHLKRNDFHLQNGSAALDRGDPAVAPASDLEGNSRPGADGLVDIGAHEADSAYTPPPDAEPPVSLVLELPPVITRPSFNVSCLASDAESGLLHVQLFYRKDGGSWTQYGDPFYAGAVQFDTLRTGGNGLYEFFTTATDNSGNTEAPPAAADAGTRVIVTDYPDSRVYVDRNAAGLETGADWPNAFHEICTAVSVASDRGVPEIWVAEGVYRESVSMASGIALRGGFAGTESRLRDRDLALHPTVIDASTADADGGPADHAVSMDRVAGVSLDGFEVTGGFANDGHYWTPTGMDFAKSLGGGLYCSSVDGPSTISNCTIVGNRAMWGGGIYCSNSSLSIIRCTVAANSALGMQGVGLYGSVGRRLMDGDNNDDPSSQGYGGGVCCSSSDVVFQACTISANRAVGFYGAGGGLMCYGSDPVFVNCTISGNKAAGSMGGGGINAEGDLLRITNCTIADNSSPSDRAAVLCSGGVVANTIFVGNMGVAVANFDSQAALTASHCLFHENAVGDYAFRGGVLVGGDAVNENAPGAKGNVSADPMFAGGPTGTWTEILAFNPSSNQTVLIDSGASFSPGGLAGRLMNVNTTQMFQSYVASNTVTSIAVVGDVTAIAEVGDAYQALDYRLQNGSAALDRGDPSAAPSTDFEGDPRPGEDGLVDIGMDEAPAAFLPLPIPSSTPTSTPTPTPTLAATLTPSPDPTTTATVVATPTAAATPTGDPIQDVIVSFYRILLDRDPEPGAVNAWQTYFAYALSFDIDVRFIPREMARLFFLSEEYAVRDRTNAGFITDCYRVFLRRFPSQTDLDNWLGGEWNRSQVMTVFSESEEFANRIAAMYLGLEGSPARNLVTFVYIGLLDRLVDQNGLEYASGLFDAAFASGGIEAVRAQAKQMAREVIVSAEFLGKQPTTADYVTRFYRAFLGRFPNDSEIAYWTGELDSSRRTADNLIDLFADSPEFTARLEECFGQ